MKFIYIHTDDCDQTKAIAEGFPIQLARTTVCSCDVMPIMEDPPAGSRVEAEGNDG